MDPSEDSWLFSCQYLDRKYFGKSFVSIHNIIIGAIFMLVGYMGIVTCLNKLTE